MPALKMDHAKFAIMHEILMTHPWHDLEKCALILKKNPLKLDRDLIKEFQLHRITASTPDIVALLSYIKFHLPKVLAQRKA